MSALPAILVVEDNDEDFETVAEAARRGGVAHPLQRAFSGDDGLRILQACVQARSPLPALVLLDLNTPADDGREALSYIKQDPRLRTIPTVILSTSTNPRDIDFCYANHANAYHAKPVNHTAHLKIVQDILNYWLASALPPVEQAPKKQ